MAIKPAGRRNNKITFQRQTLNEDVLGGTEAGAWANLFALPRMSAVFYGTGSERRAAAAEQSAQVATFNVLADSETRTVTTKDRIVFNGANWDITAVTPIGGPLPYEIDFTAMAARG